MRVVFLGGPLHRKSRILSDNDIQFVVQYKTRPKNFNSFNMDLGCYQSNFWNNLSYTIKTTSYNILCGVKYYYGETIFVHEKFDIKKSKIIQKLEERQYYERSRTKY